MDRGVGYAADYSFTVLKGLVAEQRVHWGPLDNGYAGGTTLTEFALAEFLAWLS